MPPTSPPTTSPPPTSPLPTARKSSLQNRAKPQPQTQSATSLVFPKQRAQSPTGSVTSSSGLPFPYRSNPSISTLFASTSGSPVYRNSGRSTPAGIGDGTLSGSTILSPGADGRVLSPMSSTILLGTAGTKSTEVRDLIQCGFAPHIGVVASTDVDELLHGRGFGKSATGAFLELVRPFGERVIGRVTIRDSSIGSSRSYEDFGVRFMSMKRNEKVVNGASEKPDSKLGVEGGDVGQIEEVLDRHLNFAELRPSAMDAPEDPRSDILSEPSTVVPQASDTFPSPFYLLFLRRMLSGHPLSPHETFAHPVACVIAISSRNPAPIEEFKRQYEATNTGGSGLPGWVNNDFLRYYVLVHDDDGGDIQKSTQLYEQMKRHFGLHCHLLRLRSAQCLPSDDDSVRLPPTDWMTAAEELANIQDRELSDDYDDPTPCLFESDVTSLQAFVRELITQSVVPSMERLCVQWNEQVANKRRGISGRIISISKRWTPFGGSSNSSRANSGPTGSSSYDPNQGSYRPDSSEALMRKLADYAFMLRDYKLASSTYELLRSDNEHDKAWKHYAGASEMCLVSTLLHTGSRATFQSTERWLEAATHSYIHRCATPFYALRTLLLASECLKFRGSLGVDEPSRWAARVLETPGLVGLLGSALVQERVAGFYSGRVSRSILGVGGRRRKCGFWWLMAAEGWVNVSKSVQAERCLDDARMAFSFTGGFHIDENDSGQPALPGWMGKTLHELKDRIVSLRLEAIGGLGMGGDETSSHGVLSEDVLSEEEVSEELLSPRLNRRSTIVEGGRLKAEGGLDTAPLSPVRTRDQETLGDEGFEES